MFQRCCIAFQYSNNSGVSPSSGLNIYRDSTKKQIGYRKHIVNTVIMDTNIICGFIVQDNIHWWLAYWIERGQKEEKNCNRKPLKHLREARGIDGGASIAITHVIPVSNMALNP